MQTITANGGSIPLLGLGTWQLDGAAGARIVEQALRLGYRHLDTAQAYGNERQVGEGLRASGIAREDVFVTTKVRHTNLAPEALERSVKESLAQLRLADVNLLLGALAELAGAARRNDGGDESHAAARLHAAYRRLELHRGADRRRRAARLRADRHQPDRMAPLSRQRQSEGGVCRARARRDGLLSHRARAHRRRRGAHPYRQTIWQDRRAGLAALARAAGCDRDPAHPRRSSGCRRTWRSSILR